VGERAARPCCGRAHGARHTGLAPRCPGGDRGAGRSAALLQPLVPRLCQPVLYGRGQSHASLLAQLFLRGGRTRRLGQPRQASGWLLAAGRLGRGLRRQHLRRAAARAAVRHALGRRALPPGAAEVGPAGGPDRRAGPGDRAGGRGNRPQQHDRQLADPGPAAGGLGVRQGHGERPAQVLAPGRRAGRHRLQHQDAGGLPALAGLLRAVSPRRARAAGPQGREGGPGHPLAAGDLAVVDHRRRPDAGQPATLRGQQRH